MQLLRSVMQAITELDRRTSRKADFVPYGNVSYYLEQPKGQELLTGNIQTWIKDVKVRGVKGA